MRKIAAFVIVIVVTWAVLLATARAGFSVVGSYLALAVVAMPLILGCILLAEGVDPRSLRLRRRG